MTETFERERESSRCEPASQKTRGGVALIAESTCFDLDAALERESALFLHDIEKDERQAIIEEGALQDNPYIFINAANWIETEPEATEPILIDTFDKGDKVVIIGSLKMRKTFFVDQMAISLASGRSFLEWQNKRAWKVAIIQFEIQQHHKHTRIKRLCKALNITPSDLSDNLQILNARGLDIVGREGIDRITPAITALNPDVIVFDPLYKLSDGVENSAEGLKLILNAFDVLAEKTGAAVIYVHHDAKGSPGDRDIRDRGAGSNVLGRDYDACFIITAHATEPDAVVIEVALRNYKPQEPFVIQWEGNEDGYMFIEDNSLLPSKKTSSTKIQPPPLAAYMPVAKNILSDTEMEIAPFKDAFKKQTGMSDHRLRDFMSWATSGGNPHLIIRDVRGNKLHKKWVKIGKRNNICEVSELSELSN